MEKIDFIELKIPAKPEYVGAVRLFISGIASRVGFAYDEIEDIKIAVTEACSNVTLHAYPKQEGKIIIGCAVYADYLEIVVVDHGESFDLKDIRQRIGPVNQAVRIEDLQEGGLGLYLIETLMDKVEVSNNAGVMISMTKYKRGDGVESHVSSITAPSG